MQRAVLLVTNTQLYEMKLTTALNTHLKNTITITITTKFCFKSERTKITKVYFFV